MCLPLRIEAVNVRTVVFLKKLFTASKLLWYSWYSQGLIFHL